MKTLKEYLDTLEWRITHNGEYKPFPIRVSYYINDKIVWQDDFPEDYTEIQLQRSFQDSFKEDLFEIEELKYSDWKKTQKYIVVNDLENTDFRIGMVGTSEDFKDSFVSLANGELSEEDIEILKEAIDPYAIDLIGDIWQIEIVPFEENNPEHKELAKEYTKNYSIYKES